MKKILFAVASVLACASSFAVGNHFEGFEAGWTPNQAGNWTDYNGSTVSQAASGSGGFASSSGSFHALVSEGASYASYTTLGGYSNSFDFGFQTRLDVYIDLTNAAISSGNAAAYGFDISSAASRQDGSHLRDFIFHVANDAAGNVWVNGTNNTNYSPRADLAGLSGSQQITASGWHTFEWNFRDMGDGTLAVDLNLYNPSDSLIFQTTRNDGSDSLATTVGGNRYMWVTALDGGSLAIDNTELEAVPEPGTMTLLGLGALAAWRKKRKARMSA